ncbi:hypothetical protein DPEC_G00083670 [Dallia pectoralis]|uniref:Uncharacterized protein n=1 Tax=Dallia pectoralis TaxID=75939 RepID=A0ACC2GZ26_DALPE|nr:hypothetical protein DPEC_G00083670 [Dallia pectoralis]
MVTVGKPTETPDTISPGGDISQRFSAGTPTGERLPLRMKRLPVCVRGRDGVAGEDDLCTSAGIQSRAGSLFSRAERLLIKDIKRGRIRWEK